MKTVAKVSIAAGAVALAGGVLAVGFALGWFRGGLSAEGIAQGQAALTEDWRQMHVAATNACQATTAHPLPNAPGGVGDPAQAYAATFAAALADYSSRMADLVEANVSAPPGYPASVPTPTGNVDWCKVAHDTANP